MLRRTLFKFLGAAGAAPTLFPKRAKQQRSHLAAPVMRLPFNGRMFMAEPEALVDGRVSTLVRAWTPQDLQWLQDNFGIDHVQIDCLRIYSDRASDDDLLCEIALPSPIGIAADDHCRVLDFSGIVIPPKVSSWVMGFAAACPGNGSEHLEHVLGPSKSPHAVKTTSDANFPGTPLFADGGVTVRA